MAHMVMYIFTLCKLHSLWSHGYIDPCVCKHITICFVCTLIAYQQLHHCRRQTHTACIGITQTPDNFVISVEHPQHLLWVIIVNKFHTRM